MYDLSPYLFIHMGLIIRLLRHAQGFNVGAILREGQRLAENLKNTEFSVCTAGLGKLQEFIAQLQGENAPERPLTAAEVGTLSGIMDVVEQMVYAESQTKKIYILTETRFSLDSLMNKPWQMFAQDVFVRLPLVAVYDVTEGFKCIVLARATAAAFHLLRATEATLREYYNNIVKRGRVKKPMWGNMVKHLRERRKPNEILLKRLDYIRDNYRNPTAHPDARYTIEEAQDLLGVCIDVMNPMAKTLPKIDMR